jgi:hypothetical protein
MVSLLEYRGKPKASLAVARFNINVFVHCLQFARATPVRFLCNFVLNRRDDERRKDRNNIKLCEAKRHIVKAHRIRGVKPPCILDSGTRRMDVVRQMIALF